MTTKFLFRNAAVLDGTLPYRREGQEVLVEGNTIREVSDRAIRCDDAVTIDLGGKTLMPGLIDAHVHVIALTTRLHDLASLPPSLLAGGAKVAMEDMLNRGFTSARDAGGADWGVAEAVRRGYFKGPRLFVSGLGLAQTGGQGDFRAKDELSLGCPCCHTLRTIARVVDGVDEIRKGVREELRKGANQIKVFAAGGIAGGIPVDRSHFSVEELRAAVEEARAASTYVMAHLYSSESIRRALQAGVRTVEHGNMCDSQTAKLMVEAGAFAVPTLAVYEGYHKHGGEMGYAAPTVAGFKKLLRYGIESLAVFKAAGVKIGHGSDLEGVLQQYQSREFLLRSDVLTPHEIITSATQVNAEIIQRDGKLGIVREGAYADLIVVDGDPLQNLDLLGGDGRSIKAVMKDGEFYKNLL